MMDDLEVRFPVLKVISVWLTIWLTTMWQSFSEVPWEILAQFAAFLYSAVLLLEWAIKKVRRFCRGAD